MTSHFRSFYKISKLGKDLLLFFPQTISKKQSCWLYKCLPISSQNELLLKVISDSISITSLDITKNHYDILMTKYYAHYESFKNVHNNDNITFCGAICRFRHFDSKWFQKKTKLIYFFEKLNLKFSL